MAARHTLKIISVNKPQEEPMLWKSLDWSLHSPYLTPEHFQLFRHLELVSQNKTQIQDEFLRTMRNDSTVVWKSRVTKRGSKNTVLIKSPVHRQCRPFRKQAAEVRTLYQYATQHVTTHRLSSPPIMIPLSLLRISQSVVTACLTGVSWNTLYCRRWIWNVYDISLAQGVFWSNKWVSLGN